MINLLGAAVTSLEIQGTGKHRLIGFEQKPIRVETCNGPLRAGKQASEHSIC